jgi:hypothetical protein
VRYDKKSMRLAKRRAAEGSKEFRDRYRFRAGIEGSISGFDRKTGVKKLRVRGKKAVRFCVFLKATCLRVITHRQAGLNIFRVAAYKRRRWREKGVERGLLLSTYISTAVAGEGPGRHFSDPACGGSGARGSG